MPSWLQVEDLGHMKRVLLEVIMVLVAVLFLKLVFTEQTSLDSDCTHPAHHNCRDCGQFETGPF